MIDAHKNYAELFSLENIFRAFRKFRRGKTGKKDVMNFELHLEDNLFSLYKDLSEDAYRHSPYKHFQVFDSKKRDIYKAVVRDRVVHQIVYDYLMEIFEPQFITDSYASRLNKGQYKAIAAFRYFCRVVLSDFGQCFVLKCDVRKYFDSIDQNILSGLIREKVFDDKITIIIEKILFSYMSFAQGKGIPLGNITSQIFANIYLDVLDKYVKKSLGCRFYVRYNDDFIIISNSKERLDKMKENIVIFARNKLLLDIPLDKISVRKIAWGVDFLGFTILPQVLLLRNKTKNKMYININCDNRHSYFGILNHCNAYNLRRKILSMDKLTETW